MKKFAPYGREMSRFKHDTDCIITTGSDSWQVAQRKTWQVRTPRLVLPPGDDPAAYKWPVSGRYVQVWSCGDPEPQEKIFKLARLLLQSGAVKVLLLDLSKPLVVIEPTPRRAAA